MALFKCKMCGGSLEVAADTTVIECEYCGTKQTLPNLNDEKRANMYDRANHFRRNNEFDKAAGMYEQILNDDNKDAEAYWSLVLCRYGIEYVEDPATKRRIPTINRSQFTSIFDDEDYKSALKYADVTQRSIYEAEAREINEIQKGILAISEKEDPFDVFICYKETDNNGRRTPDSVLAQELYYQLKQEGFKVFFSRITLEDKLGSAYEPYIFAALNSAKVMVVLGTKPEYFNAVWVKNEWSRFLGLIKKGKKKTLVPAYRDMDPYDLPEEFSHLQAQDMSKLGFMQDLTRGIKKIAKADQPKVTVVKETVVKGENANTETLIKRAFLFLEDQDYNSADEYAEKVLDINPECSDAYIVKLLIDLRLTAPPQISSYNKPIDKNPNYIKALRFADGDERAKIENYNTAIVERLELERKLSAYNQGCTLMQQGKYNDAVSFFAKVTDFKDSSEKIQKCRELIETARKEAIYSNAIRAVAATFVDDKTIKNSIALLKSIPGYKDVDSQIDRLQARLEKWYEDKKVADEKARIKAEQEKMEKARLEELRRVKAEENRRKTKRITIILVVLAIVASLITIVFTSVVIPLVKLNKADDLFAEGRYSEASQIYNELDGFGDSNKKNQIVKAISGLKKGAYNDAIRTLLSAEIPVEIKYNFNGATSHSSKDSIVLLNKVSNFKGLVTPEKNGYRFSKWYMDGFAYDVNVKDGNFTINLSASWNLVDYNIIYDLNGGSIDEKNLTNYNINTNSFTLINPTKTGYTFAGWIGTDISEPTSKVTVQKGSYGDRKYTAVWDSNWIKITLDPNGGTCNEEYIIVNYDEMLTLPTPTWEGHTFSGWFNGTQRVSNGICKYTSNMDLTAHWDAIEYSITYNLNGGINSSKNPSVYTNVERIVLEEPTRVGYTFLGWTYSGQSTPVKNVTISVGTTGNKTYTANWKANSYTISLDANGGTVSSNTIKVNYDETYKLPTPTRVGYTFLGWYDGTKKVEDGKWLKNENISLQAKWEAVKSLITYDVNGGSVISSSQSVTYDASYSLLTPTRTGYEFLGWYNGSTLVSQSGKWGSVQNVTLVAKWRAKTYTVTYDAGEGTSSVASATATYDSTFTLATASRTGYTFAGWYYSGLKYESGIWKTDRNITLTAKWVANTGTKYVVNYYHQNIDDNGYTLYASEELRGVSNSSVRPEVYYYEGFTSPSSITETIKADGSLIVNYYYTRNEYTITLVTNGGTTPQEVRKFKYQATLNANNWVTRTGYTFGGWFVDSGLNSRFTEAKMPAYNITLYAYWAEEDQASYFSYDYQNNGTEVRITKAPAKSTVTIPAFINGKPVTSIGYSAFGACPSLTTLTFPDSVTIIEDYAFQNCKELTKINIPDGVTSIGHYAFAYCTKIESVNIPNSVTSLGTGAFYGCTALKTVTLPSGIKSISERVFSGCKSLTGITIPNSVTSIGVRAFEYCTSIKDVVVPSSVTSIGSSAFSGCSSLESMTLPFVGGSASETSASYSTLFGYIFGTSSYTGGTKTTQYYSTSTSYYQYYYIPTTLKTVTIKGGDIKYGAFYNCSMLTSITIPDTLKSIEGAAFYNCTDLSSITIPKSVASIGSGAFYYCSSLENVYYKGTVEDWCKIDFNGYSSHPMYYGDNIYINGNSVTELIIPDTVTKIDDYAFYNWKSLKSVTIPSSVTSIGSSAFSGCSSLESMTLPFVGGSASETSASYSTLFGYIFGTSSYTGGTKTTQYYSTSTSYYQYYYIPTTLKTVTIKGGDIKYGAFYNCSMLTNITVSDTITSIGDYAFYNCTGLTSITIPKGVTSIGHRAFHVCTGLTSITIPKSVVSIGSDVFYNCKSISDVYYNGTVEDWCRIDFFGAGSTPMLYGGNIYINGNTVTELVISNTITKIDDYAFYNWTSLKSVIVPNSVTSIGSSAFSGCSSLESITLPFVGGSASATSASSSTVFGYIFGTTSYTGGKETSQYYASSSSSNYYIPSLLKTVTITGGDIRYGAFYNCSSLTSVTLAKGVINIGDKAFFNCMSMAKVTIPDGVASIGANAFYNCDMLEEVTIPGSVSYIGNYAFQGCIWLENVTISEGVTSIGTGVFSGCTALITVSIPNSITSIGSDAFYNCSALAYTEYNNAYYLGNKINPHHVLFKIKDKTASSFTMSETTKYIYTKAFEGSSIKSITIPDSVVDIGSYAFNGCKSLSNAVVGNGVINICDSAFNSCTALDTVTLGKGVVKIGYAAFSGCTKLSSINIPDKVTTIEGYAFKGTALSNIYIPASVTTIGANAFNSCSKLTNATFANASGWTVTSGSTTTNISESKLSDSIDAATLLKSYVSYSWKRD